MVRPVLKVQREIKERPERLDHKDRKEIPVQLDPKEPMEQRYIFRILPRLEYLMELYG